MSIKDEPLAYLLRREDRDGYETGEKTDYGAIPVYATPQQRKPLTDEQWQVIADTLDCLITRSQKDVIETALGIKE